MAILFSGYNFKKRVNSTKLVDSSAIISGQCSLKESTSIESPVFEMAIGASDMASAIKVNYAQVFDTYYFVTDVVFLSSTQVEFHCEPDSMANLRADIMATNAFCIYDTTINTEIPDQRLSRRTSASVVANTAAFPYNGDLFCFVVGISGKGGVTYYQILPTQLDAVLDEVNNWVDKTIDDIGHLPNWDITVTGTQLDDLMNVIGETFEFLFKFITTLSKNAMSVGHALDNIRSGMYFPFSYDGATSVKQVCLGAYETNIYSNIIPPQAYTRHKGVNVAIPWQAGDWRRRSPYTEIYLYIPLIGLMHYSSDMLVGQSTIFIDTTICWTSGAMTFEVNAGNVILGVYETNVAGSFAIGSSNINPLNVASSVAGGVASAVGGSAVGVAYSAINLANAITPLSTVIGNNIGGAAPEVLDIMCICVYHSTTVEPNSVSESVGTPSFAQRNLGSLTGYVQTSDVSVASNAHRDEIDKVNGILNGGAFIE